MTGPRRVAVVGGGWAGLAAAVRAVEAGHRVTLFEMAQQLGGRARSLPFALGGASAGESSEALDNGQHILIGAYRHTLDLLRTVGGGEDALLRRRPLELRYADGRGFSLPAGPAWIAFVRGVAGCTGWSWRDRAALVRTAAAWALDRFRCDPTLTVDALCSHLPPAVREILIDPLCVAALNTPAREASAEVLLRVLRDALFGGRGAADLLLPRRPLAELLPEPAARWLAAHGAVVRLGQRVAELGRGTSGSGICSDTGTGSGADADVDSGTVGNARRASDGVAVPTWRIGNDRFDAVVLAAPAAEAARLALPIAPAWAAQAQALRYEPIATVYLECRGARLPAPMTALVESAAAPAQFAFDHGALGGAAGRFAFVVSGAAPWVERGSGALAAAVLDQARSAMPAGTWPTTPRVLKVIVERRATFRCTPALARPPMAIAPGLLAAGDYVAGPYPATLEGAVRSGEQAAAAI